MLETFALPKIDFKCLYVTHKRGRVAHSHEV